MFDIVEFLKPLIMIWAIFISGLLFWIFLGLLAQYAIKLLIKIVESLLESS